MSYWKIFWSLLTIIGTIVSFTQGVQWFVTSDTVKILNMETDPRIIGSLYLFLAIILSSWFIALNVTWIMRIYPPYVFKRMHPEIIELTNIIMVCAAIDGRDITSEHITEFGKQIQIVGPKLEKLKIRFFDDSKIPNDDNEFVIWVKYFSDLTRLCAKGDLKSARKLYKKFEN